MYCDLFLLIKAEVLKSENEYFFPRLELQWIQGYFYNAIPAH